MNLRAGRPETFSDAIDKELFALMAARGVEDREAWAELYRRYIDDLRKLLLRLPQGRGDGLAQEAMIQAYERASTFRSDETLGADASRRRTLAWLGRIARNLYVSGLRGQRGVTAGTLTGADGEEALRLSEKGRLLSRGELQREIKELEDKATGVAGDDEDEISDYQRALQEGLDALTQRERDILIATYEHYDSVKPERQQRLPPEVIEEICQRYEINADNLRQIRKRAYQKLARIAKNIHG
jgi:RNA polymerase sigma factor (sigma-70 family)